MKHTTLLLLFVFTFTFAKSQNHSFVNIGGGFPVFFQSNFYEGTGEQMINKRINVFIEKPGVFQSKQIKGLYITPGFSYSVFNEEDSGGGLGGGHNNLFKHQAVSVFGKLIYERGFNANKSATIYTGFLSGVYLYSKTTGERSWWMLREPQNMYRSVEIDESGRAFFNSVYMGVLVGFKPFGNYSSSVITPVFEISFFPNYINISSHYINSKNKQQLSKSIFMVSVALGINPIVS